MIRHAVTVPEVVTREDRGNEVQRADQLCDGLDRTDELDRQADTEAATQLDDGLDDTREIDGASEAQVAGQCGHGLGRSDQTHLQADDSLVLGDRTRDALKSDGY